MEYELENVLRAELAKLPQYSPSIRQIPSGVYVGIYSSPERTYQTNIGWFKITCFPGCESVLIFHDVYIRREYRRQGHGTTLHNLRCMVAVGCGATAVLCTVNKTNITQRKLLRKPHPGVTWVGQKELYPGCLLYRGVVAQPKGAAA